MSDWSDNVDNILNAIRVNSVTMCNAHKNRYILLKGYLRYFKIPIIILSSCNSVLSVGGTSFHINQTIISGVVCMLSLICGIIGSIELYLSLQKQMENDHDASKSFYLLSITIFQILSLEKENRHVDSKTFLDSCINEYKKLVENSNLIEGNKYELLELPYKKMESRLELLCSEVIV
jgi:hypothetical protein